MKKILLIITILNILGGFYGCTDNGRSLKNFKNKDLTENGIPLSIKVPSGTKIVEDTAKRVLNLMEKGLEIKGDYYHIRVEKILKEYQNPRLDVHEIKDARLSLEKKISHKGEFDKVIQEDPQGFIFTTKMEPHGKTYHFFYVTIAEGRQIEFTDYFSVMEKQTEQDVRLMYESIKQAGDSEK